MHLFYPLAQRGRFAARVFVVPFCVASLLIGLMSADQIFGQLFQPRIRRTQAPGQDAAAGVYLPVDRTLSRAIARARERLAAHEYQEVLTFLQDVLGRDEDFFLERAGDDRQQLGIKATARQLIGELPPDGYQAYELLHGANARRQLEAAVRAGDRDALAKVVRQFFHTSAGYEAALVLAEIEADQGHRLAAAELYRELIETPRAASRFEPQLSVSASLNLLAAGQRNDASETLRVLLKTRPAGQIMLSGKTTSLPAPSADPLVWLSNLVGQQQPTLIRDTNWLTLHGDPSRNSQTIGGRPHLRPRWEARVVNEPSIESYVSSRSDVNIQRGVVAVPAARPIAVGDLVIMRTPENVVAVDWQTGKRIWESRDEEELQSDAASSEPSPGIDRDQWPAQGKPLEDRIWDDILVNSLSSDGKRVFVVRGLTIARDEDTSANWQAQFLGGRNGTENVAATNQLAAYDIATQGKLAWELDGGRATGKLAGAFFLGAPLAIDNTLYVMAEIRGAIYLLALDAVTGQVQWQQQLIKGLEQGIGLDSARRKASATPSYAGGVLLCPTSASTVVAIDVIKREFAWVYRYTRESQSIAEMRNFWQQQQAQPQLARANNQWLDSSAIIAEGRVLLTPPDSSEIHCLDLHSGKLAWKRRQGDSLFLGSVDHGNVLVIGGQSIQALRLSDGNPAWERETLSLPTGVLPAGQGYLSDGHYFLPLTSGQIAEIDMSAGKLETFAPAGSNVVLGNLICYRGSVLSQSPLLLDKFEQLTALRQRTGAALARNSNDAAAIRQMAELASSDGKKTEAIRLLKHSYEIAPDDPVTQEMLVETLLDELATDYAAFRNDVPLAAKLIHNREQQIELMRIDAAGLDQTGQRMAAWDAYLRLTDFTAEEPAYLRIQDKYTVRSDHWISGRLATLWSSASSDERKTITEKLAARRSTLSNPRTAAELRHYISHLGQLPGAGDVRLALARFLVEHGRPQEAEIELLESLASGNAGEQAAATELMSKLTSKANSRSDRAPFQWPNGQVDAELNTTASASGPRDRGPNMSNERQQPAGYRQLRIEQDFWPQAFPMHWFISTDGAEIIGRNTLGDDVFHLAVDPASPSRQSRDINLVHAARLGHLLYVALGGQIMAIDSRQDRQNAEVDLLWPSQSPEGIARDVAHPRRGLMANEGRVKRPPLYHAFGRKRLAGAQSVAIGSLGPVTPRGVVFQDDNEIKCVDPLTGVTLWARTDVPPGCELFGDGELVIAADVSSDVAYTLRLTDGQLLEKRERPKPEWLLTAGRNVAQLTSARGNRSLLTVTDVWQQKTLYQTELPGNARFSVIEPNALAVLEPSGQFRVVDVQSGKLAIDEKLDAIPDLQAIYTMRAGDELYMFATGPVQSQFRSIGQPLPFDFPLINGPVYAFSIKTGKSLWTSPAKLRNRGIVLSEPPELPFLVFVERQTTRDAAAGGGAQLRVLCLDKRTGGTVYRNDHLPDTPITRFRLRGETESRPQVILEMGATKILLSVTDRPRLPQSPADDDLEVSKEVFQRGLRGLGERMGDALRDALDKSIPPAPNQQNGDKKPVNGAKSDTDDD
jgi:outer membrane protein assembly factor BamB